MSKKKNKIASKPKGGEYSYMHLAKELKQLRVNGNYSLRFIEKCTGISNSYLSQIETGQIKNPGVFTINKLAKFYHVKINFLVNELTWT